ncbi:CsgG/HfaB family protein [Thermodesulfobacteriota bacterium]
MNLKNKIPYLSIVFFLLLSSTVAAQTINKNTIAVLPFTEKEALDIQGAGKIVADWFLHELFKTTTDYLVERIDLHEVMKEYSIQQTEVIDSNTVVQIGKLFGAKYIVFGVIEKWHNNFSITVKLLDTKKEIMVYSENFIVDALNKLPHQLPLIAKNLSDTIGTIKSETKVSLARDIAPIKKRILSVIPFNVRNDVGVNEAGRIIADWFVSELANLNRDQVVERMDLEKILNEQSLQLSGMIDENTAVQLGKIKGANYLVLGSIERWLDKVSITTRLVDVEKGIIVRSEKAMSENMGEVPNLIPSIAKLLTLTIEERKKKVEELAIKQTRLGISASIDIKKFLEISKNAEIKTEFSIFLDDKLIVRKRLFMGKEKVEFPDLLNLSLPPGKHKISCALNLKYLQDEVATISIGSLKLPQLRNGQIINKTVEKEVYIDESDHFDAYINYSKDIKIDVYIKPITDRAVTGNTWYLPVIEIKHGALLDEYRLILRRTIPHAEESLIKYIFKKAQRKSDFIITDHIFSKKYKVRVLPDGLISVSEM